MAQVDPEGLPPRITDAVDRLLAVQRPVVLLHLRNIRRRHPDATPEQVIRKLRESDRLLAEGKDVAEVARHLEISEPTYHRWRNQYGGMKADDAKRLARQIDIDPAGERKRHDERRAHEEVRLDALVDARLEVAVA